MAAGDASLRLYAILDAESCARRGLDLLEVARVWRDAGVRLLQYRDKVSARIEVETRALALRSIFKDETDAILILNDYVELVSACGFDGAHVGQTDASVAYARSVLGDGSILGVSTHSADEAMLAAESDCDYVAIGPVFMTTTKPDAAPAVGLCGVQAARAVVRKPLVAIGGIGPQETREVREAGADSIAVISALLDAGGPPEEQGSKITRGVRDFLLRLK